MACLPGRLRYPLSICYGGPSRQLPSRNLLKNVLTPSTAARILAATTGPDLTTDQIIVQVAEQTLSAAVVTAHVLLSLIGPS